MHKPHPIQVSQSTIIVKILPKTCLAFIEFIGFIAFVAFNSKDPRNPMNPINELCFLPTAHSLLSCDSEVVCSGSHHISSGHRSRLQRLQEYHLLQ